MRRPVVLVLCGGAICTFYLLYNLKHDNSDRNSLMLTPPFAVQSNTRNYLSQLPRKTCSSNQTYIDFGAILNKLQTERVAKCVANYDIDAPKGLQKDGIYRPIRYTSHAYLNSSSFMIEAGGHLGHDISEFNSRYHPGHYVVLEPVGNFFNVLREKFKDSPNIVLYNFGVDVNDGVFQAGQGNDGTSIYKKGKDGFVLKIVAVSKLFEKLKVAEKKVDLVTLNCEGCEYAFLDFLLSTDYIHQFRNIQYQSHRVPEICFPVKRFCWYQELLAKTHKLVFQHKFTWESWTQT
ncbi:uncharacterized protein LOC110450446 [Mizuhopecten yessoensis]|uniref:Methyltransferase FkbM domain-containing protein n=1 Tax=Mizuhopecten yessoensis TaxID=6573 RepID=A0A210QNV4_MIZYE|nr:uncharacterized protein LOC110450446 [Mizuhopecten yessoensis]OWF50385.1 hypothetical protein KP79_PYT09462 [Mizuhopecten yessoensis]